MSDPQTVMIKASDPATQGDFVVINEADFDPIKHEKVVPPPPAMPAAVPPPPDGKPDIPKDWRKLSNVPMKSIALSLTGRMPENVTQAVEMIEEVEKAAAAK